MLINYLLCYWLTYLAFGLSNTGVSNKFELVEQIQVIRTNSSVEQTWKSNFFSLELIFNNVIFRLRCLRTLTASAFLNPRSAEHMGSLQLCKKCFIDLKCKREHLR